MFTESTDTGGQRSLSVPCTASPEAPTCSASCRCLRCRLTLTAAIYLLLFGVGSVAAMGTFASLVGWFADGPVRTRRAHSAD